MALTAAYRLAGTAVASSGTSTPSSPAPNWPNSPAKRKAPATTASARTRFWTTVQSSATET
jgi:hypothetical protein